MRYVPESTLSFVAVALVTFAVAGCGGGEDSAEPAAPEEQAPAAETAAEPEATTEEAAAAEAPSFELRVGSLMPLTGDLASHGPSLDSASHLAVDLINAALEEEGLAEAISASIVSEDSQTEAPASVEAATKLTQTDEVDVIVGGMSSASFIPTAQSVTIPNGVLHIGPTVSAREITDLEDDGLVYRMISADIVLARGLAEAAGEAFGTDATVNLGARNDAWGSGLKEMFERHWTENGGTLGVSIAWNPEQPTFDTEAQQLASGDPNGWVILEWPENFAKLGPALVRSGSWTPDRTFMTEAMAVPDELTDIGDQATVGLRGIAPTSETAPAFDPFQELFTEEVPDKPFTGFEGSSFDAVMLAFLASVSAGSSDPAEVKEHLQAVSGPPGTQYTYQELGEAVQALLAGEDIDYEGAWGSIDWDEHGDPGSDVFRVWEYTGQDIETLTTFTSTAP